MDIAKRLRKKRLSKRLSQEKLARLLNVTTRTIQRWEQGLKPSEMHFGSVKKFLEKD